MPITTATAEPTPIPGLHVLRTKVAEDDRGAVREIFRPSALAELGLPRTVSYTHLTLPTICSV